MKKTILLVSIVLIHYGLFSQSSDSLTLEFCLHTAGSRSPLNGEKKLTMDALAFKLKNLGTNWLPAIGLNAQAMYNSETVNFSDVIKNLPVSIPSLPLDQYKIWADLNQPLYDGGMIRAQKSIEKASSQADLQQVETELLGLKQQVNQTYFSLLLSRKSAEVMEVSLHDLLERKKVVQSGVDNGAILPENLLAMDAEELRLRQGLLELNMAGRQLVNVLSILMDTTVAEQAKIILPNEPEILEQKVERPEYLLFESQKDKLQASQKLVTATDMPKLFAFSQGAYGRPGYNIVSQKFHTFYAVGMGLKWNFLNYGDSRRQKKLLEFQQDLIDIKKRTFDDQLDIQLEAEKTNQAKYSELLSADEQILKLRKEITAASFVKLTNGVITSTDYFSELNNELLARLQFETHRILKLQAAYNYLLLQGKL
jgi:outer membrane protein TolC